MLQLLAEAIITLPKYPFQKFQMKNCMIFLIQLCVEGPSGGSNTAVLHGKPSKFLLKSVLVEYTIDHVDKISCKINFHVQMVKRHS